MDRPKIRSNIEALPVQSDDNMVFVLRDPEGHAPGVVTAPAVVVWLLQHFDGVRTQEQIRTAFFQQFGQTVAPEQLEQIVSGLDEALLLEGGRYEAARQEFLSLSARPTSHAGVCYPADRAELTRQMEAYYLAPKGPGALPGQAIGGPAASPPVPLADRPLRALVAPHIDIRSGGPCFAHAYHALSMAPPADLFVILGTGHAGLAHGFAAAAMDFETPLGVLKTDRAFLDRIARRFGPELYDGAFAHRNEHVIEFQAVFLKHLYGDRDIAIAPILCSYGYSHADRDADGPMADQARRFHDALRQAIAETDQSVCVIASVDLAHIGPQYGGPAPVASDELEASIQADARLLEALAAWDSAGFVDAIAREQDGRHICGFPCLHTLLECVDGSAGRVLAYDWTEIDGAGSYVSFASLVFD